MATLPALLEATETLLASAKETLTESDPNHRLVVIHLGNAVAALKRAHALPKPDSLPPIFALNRDARMTAEDHFRKSRELVKGIIKK